MRHAMTLCFSKFGPGPLVSYGVNHVNGFGELLHLLETLNSGTLLIFIFHSIMYRVILIICSCKLSTMAVLVCSVSNLSSGIFGFGGGSSPVWH